MVHSALRLLTICLLVFGVSGCGDSKIEVFDEVEIKTLLVRLYNPTGKVVRGRLKFLRHIRKAWRTNLNEERQAELERTGGKSLSIQLGSKRIETFEIEF